MPDHRTTGMFSFKKRVRLCCAGLVVLTTTAGLLYW